MLLPAAFIALVAAAPAVQPPRPPFPIWPLPRESRYEDARLLLTDAVVVVPAGDLRAQWPGRLLAEIVADQFGVALPVAVGSAPEGRTPIVVGEEHAVEEELEAELGEATETQRRWDAMIAAETEDTPLGIAIVGRPNVGKSALVNAILGEERVIVSEVAGTTRDAVDTPFAFEGEAMTLVDTAGIRRPGRIEGSIEHYSVLRARQAVHRADVAVVVFDAADGLRAQDLHIVGLALEASAGLVVCANKWDLVKDTKELSAFTAAVRRRLRFAPWAPVAVVSALERTGLDDLLRELRATGEERRRRVPTSELNAVMRGAMARRPPPVAGRRRLKLLYVTQARTEPPTFVFFVNDARLVVSTYERYLENALRGAFGFRGAGLKLIFRTRGESPA